MNIIITFSSNRKKPYPSHFSLGICSDNWMLIAIKLFSVIKHFRNEVSQKGSEFIKECQKFQKIFSNERFNSNQVINGI